MSRELGIALDFGGTKLAAGLVDLQTGEVYNQVRERTPVEGGREASLKTVLKMVREGVLARGADGLADRFSIAGIGVSFGGHVNSVQGVVERSMHVAGWESFPLASYLAETFSLPTFIENDANASALGLKYFGPGKDLRQFIYVTVSTGIGAALVMGNDVLWGGRNLAGEIGHMVMQPGGPLCSCGKRGCLEALASGPAIAQTAQRLRQERASTGSSGGNKGIRFERAEDVFQAAEAGDDLARYVIEEAARFLGLGISYAVNLFDPDCVMIGGGVSRGNAEWFETVKAEVLANVLPSVAQDLMVMRVHEDITAALKGAAALILARAECA